MGILVFLVIIAIIVGYVLINIKISNLKYRAKQQVLKNTGISSSDICAGITGSFEKKHLERFLSEYPNFIEETLKKLFKQYTIELFNKNSISEFSQTVCEKMKEDSKLEKIKNMEFRRTNINYYANSKLEATVVYTNNRDEYEIYLTCNIQDGKIKLEKYKISKGAVVGF